MKVAITVAQRIASPVFLAIRSSFMSSAFMDLSPCLGSVAEVLADWDR
jgi:hypothetical protein